MSKEKVAEALAEKLQEYAYEVGNGEHESFYDDYIVDELLEMRELLYKDDIEEGRYYQQYTLTTDQNLKLYDVVEVQQFLSGEKVKLKVMSIDSIKPSTEGRLIVEFLGRKVK